MKEMNVKPRINNFYIAYKSFRRTGLNKLHFKNK